MADPNVGAIVASTLRDRKDLLADNVTNHNAFLYHLNKKGNIKTYESGGRTIFEPIIHGSNSSIQWYDGYTSFTPPTTVQETLDGAEYQWKQQGGFISISGKEKIMNSGKARVIDLAEARVTQLMANLRNAFATALYADGTGSGGLELGGLQLLVADDPTLPGTVGSIPQATNAFWRNQFSAAAATTSANIQDRLNAIYLDALRGNDKPDLILAGKNMYTHYLKSLQPLQQVTNAKMADAGFTSLEYMGAPYVFDDACDTNRLYLLNTDYLKFRYAGGRWFETEDPRKVTNADYEVVPVFTMGNLTCSSRGTQAVIIAS